MTAEIAIMNKEAIALAADSAVTLSQERGEKTFPSANKLFALSKYHPVGVMVYGNATFMDVPWEIIIKIYRRKRGKTKFDTLRGYADDLIGFLNRQNPLFPANQQSKHVYWNCVGYFNNQIKKEIRRTVKSAIAGGEKITDTYTEELTSRIIKKHYNQWRKAKLLPTIPKTHMARIQSKYGSLIRKATQDVFEDLRISPVSRRRLAYIAASLFVKDFFSQNISGLVIAGFGDKEAFPSLRAFDMEIIAGSKLKHRERTVGQITYDNDASVISFAQSEMVNTFMEGVDPVLQKYIAEDLSHIFDKYPEIIVQSIRKFDDNEKRTLLKKLQQVSRGIFEEHLHRVVKYKRAKHVDPIIQIVAMLPKDELASMAESLVNLTSFKRRVTPELETVGGPIDVAVISKGDGFIWIKRKHYFEPQLNHQFFANYYRES